MMVHRTRGGQAAAVRQASPSAGWGMDCHPDRLHQLLGAGPRAQRRLGVAPDAVRTLRDVGHGDRDDLLRLAIQRSVGDDLLREGTECLLGLGGELLPLVGELVARGRVDVVIPHILPVKSASAAMGTDARYQSYFGSTSRA